ncbi:MAG: hypothetical protein CV087_15775 [Candidatus Brocadia sp. WS118]|nr:MAG: hypothetical protein CV087_15775 [Candidatus Brocadia sp. WS118]
MSSNKILNPIPAITEVDRIAAIQDPIIRNLQITQCYHELSAVLAERTRLSANWCTFATWASKQAGQTIRTEDLVRSLENILDTEPTVTRAIKNVVTTTHHIGGKRDLPENEKTVLEILNPFEAIDRADLPDRLHFIIDLFRCYQELKDLFEPPFTAEQVTAIKNGHLPDGRL